jgi:integrase
LPEEGSAAAAASRSVGDDHLEALVLPARRGRDADSRGVRFHVVRHSACSALATMGAPMIAIQALAGRESPQTTARYMHLAPGVQAAAVALFDQVSWHEPWHALTGTT